MGCCLYFVFVALNLNIRNDDRLLGDYFESTSQLVCQTRVDILFVHYTYLHHSCFCCVGIPEEI